MDLAPLKHDIDDLIDDFAAAESTRFADMKRVWKTKKFSYIYDARPTCTNTLALFMQTLYSHSIGHLISPHAPLTRRLGGLYCLYCLHETQPFKPPFKIYLSLEELKKLRKLVGDARAAEGGLSSTVSGIVKRLMEKKAFLLGFVETNEGLKGKVDELTELENARTAAAWKKLFSDTRIEEFIHMDMGMEVDLSKMKQMSWDYDELKRAAVEAAEGGDEEMRGVVREKELIGEKMEKISREWDAQREVFYKQTGLTSQKILEEEEDSFDKELEMLLEKHNDDESDGI